MRGSSPARSCGTAMATPVPQPAPHASGKRSAPGTGAIRCSLLPLEVTRAGQ
jgi:hypothetical protein